MNKLKILYFGLSFVILMAVGFLVVDMTQPKEIPVMKTISFESTVSETTTAFSTESEMDETTYITSESETEAEQSESDLEISTENEVTEVEFPINLNTATKEELMQVSGIGEVTAERIIEYRNQNGSFYSLYQLTEIKGIGDAKYEKFRPFLFIENEREYVSTENEAVIEEATEIITEIIETTTEQTTTEVTTTEEIITTTEEIITEPVAEIPRVELNSASFEDFMKLPDIDEEMAHKIVEFREKIQYFEHPYELLYIDGMSESRLAGIIDYLYIEGKEDIIY